MAVSGTERDQFIENDLFKMTKKSVTIYIVEDELLIASCLKDQLEDTGYQILGASTRGEESIEELTKLRNENCEPMIVLMDINLRGKMDGIETARHITELFDCSIIFLTGQSSREIYERSSRIKPFSFVLKPYDQEQMIMAIEIAAYQRELEQENKEIKEKLASLLSKNSTE